MRSRKNREEDGMYQKEREVEDKCMWKEIKGIVEKSNEKKILKVGK